MPFLIDAQRLKRDLQVARSERSLRYFLKMMWHAVEPVKPFVDGWVIGAICEHLEAVSTGEIKRLLMNVSPGSSKSLTSDVFFPAWEWGPLNAPSTRYICASRDKSLTERDNGRFLRVVRDPQYQEYWGDRFQILLDGVSNVTNHQTGFKLATSAQGTTGHRADRFIIDDPNSTDPRQAESDTIRTGINLWLREVVPDRLNDLDDDAIILIQQRTHADDATQAFLEAFPDCTWLMVPMEYDPGRRCVTVIGWEDPREVAGELAWPNRFSAEAIAALKVSKGSYAYACTPGESPILMADLTNKPISQIRPGDRVVGFQIDTDRNENGNRTRKRLVESEVLHVHKYPSAPIQRMTLDSGETVRCTKDHRWFTNRNPDISHQVYAPARIGTKLMRVCPPSIDYPDTPEKVRAAGWLAGFFDGEGSVSLMKRRAETVVDHAVVTFSQTAERNLPICERLEANLRLLDFDFGVGIRKRTASHWMESRLYFLRGDHLPLMQRFLHIVGPSKWRERMTSSAFKARFIKSKERVVAIEDDGVEDVYALTTTTGNYVVWGIASSNSQYDQLPTQRGGELIKRTEFQPWPPFEILDEMSFTGVPGRMTPKLTKPPLPPLEYVIASYDGNLTMKESGNPAALSIWGVFRAATAARAAQSHAVTFGPNGLPTFTEDSRPKVILLHAWSKHLSLNGGPEEKPYGVTQEEWDSPVYLPERQRNWGSVQWIVWTCRRYRVDQLVIEAKANGFDVANEISINYRNERFLVDLVTPIGDKYARLLRTQPTFANQQVYVPYIWSTERQEWDKPSWAEELITQVCEFPRSKYDDLTDTSSQAINYLRDTNWLVPPDMAEEDWEESIKWKPKPQPVRRRYGL